MNCNILYQDVYRPSFTSSLSISSLAAISKGIRHKFIKFTKTAHYHSCRINLLHGIPDYERNIIDSRIQATYESDEAEFWDDFVPLLLTFKMRKVGQTHIQVPTLNNSHHNAFLQPNVTLKSLHQIKSISPIEPVKLTDKKSMRAMQQILHKKIRKYFQLT